jgi:hypothetical protein
MLKMYLSGATWGVFRWGKEPNGCYEEHAGNAAKEPHRCYKGTPTKSVL